MCTYFLAGRQEFGAPGNLHAAVMGAIQSSLSWAFHEPLLVPFSTPGPHFGAVDGQ